MPDRPGHEVEVPALDEHQAMLLAGDAEATYDGAPCGFLSTTPDGTIIKVNQTFLDWTGYQRANLVGRTRFSELLTVGGRIYHETHYAPLLQMQGTAREIALDIVTAGGGRLPSLVNSILERDPQGEPLLVRTAVFDATERRQFELELVRARQRAEASEARATLMVQTLQQTLVPPATPEIEGLRLAGGYRPAGDGTEVGGDFYDVFEIEDGAWMVVIGDVCGKGAEAAVVTALARYTLRAAAIGRPELPHALETLNEVLLRHPTDRFCTAAILRMQPEGGGWRCTSSAGGHPLPWVVRAGQAPAPWGRPGSILGLFERVFIRQDDLLLEPGDSILVHTDGVTEGRRGRELFGDDRLAASIERHHAGGPKALVEGIVDDLTQFQGDLPRDDIALVALQVPT